MMNKEIDRDQKILFCVEFFFFYITFLRSEIMEVVSDYWPPLWHRVFRSARFEQRARI